MAEAPPFETFFAATHKGRPPLPWQARLAATVAAEGWPPEIGVPTGLGKTACIDIAVWDLARQAQAQPRTAPTRTWYVVNRRLLVDAAYDGARELNRLLGDPERLRARWEGAGSEHVEVLGRVAEALRSLAAIGVSGDPLHLVQLRGGSDLGERSPEPSQPALLFATVPMFASRWLFRGYGSSTGMRPVDAAHAGSDSLVLLDEAHLAPALARLVRPLRACDPGSDAGILPDERSSPRFVALTATGGSPIPFDLDDDDFANPVVRQRVFAPKPVAELIESKEKRLAADLAGAARRCMEDRARTSCLVFTNTPGRARAVEALLRESADGDVLLVTGRTREHEARRLRERLLDPGVGVPAGRPARSAEAARTWIVATQTLEVGADIDVDVLVTETAGTRALVQRLGRCNRLGSSPSPAVVICHASDLDQPLYGDEVAEVWRRLREAPRPLSLSPLAVRDVLGAPRDVAPRSPEILPALLWEWAKTSCPPPGEAPVEAYFSPLEDPVARVSVCWRVHRPPDGVALQNPMRASETIDLPVGEARAFLVDRGCEEIQRLAAGQGALETVPIGALRPGDVVVLDPALGGNDDNGWNPDARQAVLDLSLVGEGRMLLPLSDHLLHYLLAGKSLEAAGDLLGALLDEDDEDAGPDRDRELARALLDVIRAAEPPATIGAEAWSGFVGRWTEEVVRPVGDVPHLRSAVLQRVASVELRSEAFEQLSFDATSVDLAEHLGSVGQTAARIAHRLGLDAKLVGAVEMAGRWHDLGKWDSRFQRWLDPDGSALDPVAKSALRRDQIEAMRVASGWPRGGRHEAISGQLLQAWLARADLPELDEELVLHLVLSHHGHGRPLVPVAQDGAGIVVEATVDGVDLAVPADLGAPDWQQPARFRALCERYGYWGLALLEAIVRQADHVASARAAGRAAEPTLVVV